MEEKERVESIDDPLMSPPQVKAENRPHDLEDKGSSCVGFVSGGPKTAAAQDPQEKLVLS